MITQTARPRSGPPVAQLVTRARNGDQQAWDALIGRYDPLVWSVCRRYRLDHADAEDVGQTIWLRLVGQLDRLREPNALPGWLVTTTRRECLQALDSARRSGTLRPVLAAEDIPDQQTATAEQELLAAERRAALREAFAQLPPYCQRLLALLVQDPRPLRRDQRPAGHLDRQHRAHPQPLPGQAAPPPGHRRPDQRRKPGHGPLGSVVTIGLTRPKEWLAVSGDER